MKKLGQARKKDTPMKLALLVAGLLASSASCAGWMTQFASQPLNKLVIPGSHDSGAYEVSVPGVTSPDFSQIRYVPDFLQAMFVKDWGKSQSLSVGQQLTAGYRYLDLRLCGKGNTVYTCHGVYTAPLSQIVADVKSYLSTADASSEVIVMDINHLYGMSPELNASVASTLGSQLGQWIASPSQFTMSTPVGKFASANKHLIITYADQSTQVSNSNMLWPTTVINSPWPNAQTASSLEAALSISPPVSTSQLYVHQTQLTPSAQIIEGGFLPGHPSTLRAFTSGYEATVANWIQSVGIGYVASGGVIVQDFVGDGIFSGRDLTQYAIIRNQQMFAQTSTVSPFSTQAPPSSSPKPTVLTKFVNVVKSLLKRFF
ncbi:hypothetical protein G3O06_26300 [Burkholderia sp. Ac-20345]|nr:hypothetical protein [Burkholderia sp. Ac-20345]